MLVLNINGLLTDRGIERQHLFLQKLGIGRTSATNLLHNGYSFINTLHLSKICYALNCSPSELFVWIDSPNYPLSEGHTLQKLKKKDKPPVAARIRNLNADQLDKLTAFLEEIEIK